MGIDLQERLRAPRIKNHLVALLQSSALSGFALFPTVDERDAFELLRLEGRVLEKIGNQAHGSSPQIERLERRTARAKAAAAALRSLLLGDAPLSHTRRSCHPLHRRPSCVNRHNMAGSWKGHTCKSRQIFPVA